MNTRFGKASVLATILLVAAGCGSDGEGGGEGGGTTVTDGQALYEMPHEDGNTFACATCHALSEPTADGFTRPGHPIGDAARRPSWKNGQLTRFIDAVNTCRQDWLGAPPFEETDERWQMLEGFLLDQAGDAPAEALTFEIADPPADMSGGDPMAGEETFNSRCIVCHGESGIGTERAPTIAGTMLDEDFIGLKVRRSGNQDSAIYPDLIFGRMPFWAPDRVSDDQLRDIAAFLIASEPPTEIMVTGDEVDLSVDGAQQSCGSSHPRVGQSLTFDGNAHDVAGTATVVDDCTIRFDDFSFDGGGIDVHVYGGVNGNYDLAIDLSVNMVGTAFDSGSAIVRLPDGRSLDDFDGLSIWCVPVGVSFGDGQF